MKRTLAIAVYEHRVDRQVTWWPLVPRDRLGSITGTSEVRMREELGKAARAALREVEPGEQELWDAPPGLRLHRVHLDLATRGPQPKRVAGPFPLIVEPRWFGDDVQRLLAYHPHAPGDWFDVADLAEAETLAPHFARKAWAGRSADDLEALKVTGKDRLIVVSFTVEPRSLLDRKPKPTERSRAGVGRAVKRVLSDLGVDQTARAIDRTLPVGVAREPYRGQLGRLLGGDRPRSTVLVGRPGSGRSTLLAHWVADRLEEDGWYLHRNSDRIHHVWRLSGKRLIAGMQYFGDWEERCLDVVEDARKHKGILWFDDLHLFGRLGVTRQSERSFADFFRGPVQRGELVVVGTATREQLARLEDDAPAFAGLFTRVAVEPTTTEQTRALLMAEIRRLEVEHPVAIHPFAPRTITELAGALFPWTAAPGAAIELVRKLVGARASLTAGTPAGGDRLELGPREAVALAARETGLPEHLITLDRPLDPAAVEAHFASRVIGQDEAVAVATEVVLKVRAGLTDAARPLGVYLFTGPTGTGKTELATALAEYLYGDARRLLRFDMSELSGPDAVARLIGDRYAPEGLLTQRIREQPFAVVLLDEIEKAHPAVLALLLQLFDEGRLTDAAGDVASFRHAVVVMTSNLGAKVAAPIGFGDGAAAILGDIARAVREFFPPELWNRIDRVVRFRPLTPEVAARVVDKELAKLLGRRGLRERNVFVYAGRAIRERAVAQAFDPRYGARTVKRWLEDHVATALAQALTVAPPARLSVARLRDDGPSVAVDLEVLTEVDPLPGDYPLAELRELSAAALVPHAEAMADEIDAVLDGDALRAQEDAARRSPRAAEVRYFVEAYRDELAALRETLVGDRRRPEPAARLDDSEDEIVHDLEHRHEQPARTPWDRTRPPVMRSRFDRRSLSPRRHHRLEQPAALAALARARLLIDHVDQLADPDAHVVTIDVTPVGRVGTTEALRWMLVSLDPYEESVIRTEGGEISTKGWGLGDRAAHAVVVVRELFAAAALGPEHGSHVVQWLADEPEIVRVAVTRGATAPLARVQAHQQALAAFDAAVERGDGAAANPEPLLPVVRILSLRASPRIGTAWSADVEDLTTGFVGVLSGSDPAAMIRQLRHLRWSRRGGG